MKKPRIFLGSSNEQSALLDLITVELGRVAYVDSWITQFDAGKTTLGSLFASARDADFALFVLAPDDLTVSKSEEQVSPRDNVVFEAGLFGGILGIERTFLLYASGTKLPSDLKGLTLLVYDPKESVRDEMARECAKVRGLFERYPPRHDLLPGANLLGTWWQFTYGGAIEKSAVSLMKISRRDDGYLELEGRAWSDTGEFLARYKSLATAWNREGLFYYWEGEYPNQTGVPAFYGKGEIHPSSKDRAAGYFTTRSINDNAKIEKIATEYRRAQTGDREILEGGDAKQRALLIGQRLHERQDIVQH